MSPPVEAALIIAAFMGNIIAVVLGAYLTWYFGRRAARDAAKAATLVAEVAVKVGDTAPLLQEISTTGKATHVLVNNDRSILKVRIADLTRIVAKLLPGDPDAERAARIAADDAARSPLPNPAGPPEVGG